MPQLRVGTSGWTYEHWRGGFYPTNLPQTRWLEYYQAIFDTVELNSTFYGTPNPETVEHWHDRTSPGFLFAVKSARYLTHKRKLREPGTSVKKQNEALRPLKDKLGPVLWQLPGTWHLDLDRLTQLVALRPPERRWCFEFRHSSWFCAEVYELLRQTNCALVWADAPPYPFAAEVTADFLYARLHGPEQLYGGKYTLEQLQHWRDLLLGAARGECDIFVYFDNDAEGHAPHDAWRLRELLHDERQVPDLIPEEVLKGDPL